jgi:NAD(P)-dependent dehydrogenase (short-subunit alcohol dehydrogenase family)
MTLSGKVAVVTGAGRGIGEAVAVELARKGARVALAAKTATEINAVAAEINSTGGLALAIPMDVGVPEDVQHLFQAVESHFGPVEILVSNAGVRGPTSFIQNVPPEDFMEVLRVNLYGTFLCARTVLPGMIERRWGRIINMSGAGAFTGARGGGPYGASKSAVEGLTRTIALEVGRFGITCNAIQPGRVDTRTFPLAESPADRQLRAVGPEHAARCAAWLASEEASDVTGQTVNAVEWDKEHSS